MDCIFCKIATGEIPASIVHRDEELIAFRDIRPQAPVHLLIIPRQHIATILEVKPAQEELLSRMVLLANELAKSEGVADQGFRLVFNCKEHGGQDVFHVHLHLLGGRRMGWPPG